MIIGSITMNKKSRITKKVISSVLTLSLVSVSTLHAATINPIDYDTITGTNNQFIDVKSNKFLLKKNEWNNIVVWSMRQRTAEEKMCRL